MSDSKHIGFNALAKRIAKEYRDKGYSAAKAKEWGIKTAGKVAAEKGDE